MKLLIVTPLYLQDKYPISHILRGLYDGLKSSFINVNVLTTDVFYEHKNAGEDIITVNREYSESTNILAKLGNNLLITLSIAFKLLSLPRYDLIYCVVPPNILAFFIVFICKIKKAKLVLNVQDVHPDVLINLGSIRNRFLVCLLKKIQTTILNNSSGIVVITPSFKENLCRKCTGAPIVIIPNWVDLNFYQYDSSDNLLKDFWGIPDEKHVILYAGTLGRIHGTQLLLDIARRCQDERFLFLIVGHGADFEILLETVKKFNIVNVLIKPTIDYEMVPMLQALSDLSVVAMHRTTSHTSLPSKMIAYMAASKPILALVDDCSDIAQIVKTNACGLVDSSYDPNSILQTIYEIFSNDSIRSQMSKNSRLYAENNLSLCAYIDKHIDLFTDVLK